MKRKQQNKVERLIRRRDWLLSRVEATQAERDPSRDLGEIGALDWALRIIDAAEARGLLDELAQREEAVVE